MKFIKHENTWSWGHSTIIITSNAYGTVTVQFDNDFKDEGFICSLSVFKDKRNKGYGTALIREAEKYSLERGCTHTALRVDKESWMYDWYKRLGYKDEGFSFDEKSDEIFPILSKKLK